MTLASLLKSLRKMFGNSDGREKRESEERRTAKAAIDPDDSADIDPFNPFPDPVVIEFQDVIDLHSIPPKQIRAVVEDDLEEAHKRGVEFVRIIHGKGIGVQRE